MTDKYKGWAIAVVSLQGNVQLGYLGRIAFENGGADHQGGLILDDAVEIQTQLQVSPEGPRMGRAALPVMFFEGVTRVRVWPLALHPLDSLSEQDATAIDQLLQQGKMLRESLRPTTGAIVPATPQALLQIARDVAKRNGVRI